MLIANRLETALNLIQKAIAHDNDCQYELALKFYRASLEHWALLVKYEQTPKTRQVYVEKMSGYMSRAEQIKAYLSNGNFDTYGNKASTDGAGCAAMATKPPGQNYSDEDRARMANQMNDTILQEKPDVRWSDIAGLELAKETLKEAVIVPTQHSRLFTENDLKPWRGILFYGPPGTGKSFLAKACATEASSTFFSISSSDIVAKWQGESERLVRALFEAARANKPSIIFIDEIDSLAGVRSDQDNESSRRIKTEFLVQMDGVGKDDSGLLILGATNTPWNLDPAFRRRFERRIYIPLPDEEARRTLIEKKLKNKKHTLNHNDVEVLTTKTEGFSCADIEILIRDVFHQSIKKSIQATHFKAILDSGGKKVYQACSPSDPDSSKIEASLQDLPENCVVPPSISTDDLLQSLSRMKPSVNQADLARFNNFTEQFGMQE